MRHFFTKMRHFFYKNAPFFYKNFPQKLLSYDKTTNRLTRGAKEGKRRPNLNNKQKILHDERIFFYKDDLVLAHMGANSRRALILSNWFLGGR